MLWNVIISIATYLSSTYIYKGGTDLQSFAYSKQKLSIFDDVKKWQTTQLMDLYLIFKQKWFKNYICRCHYSIYILLNRILGNDHTIRTVGQHEDQGPFLRQTQWWKQTQWLLYCVPLWSRAKHALNHSCLNTHCMKEFY